jgi:hypothetical protein
VAPSPLITAKSLPAIQREEKLRERKDDCKESTKSGLYEILFHDEENPGNQKSGERMQDVSF